MCDNEDNVDWLKSAEGAQWWQDGNTANILVTGKTGTGKSALINGLVGKEVATEGEDLDPQTSAVTGYKISKDEASVVVWDSPGLQDGTEREEAYVRDMKSKCENVDLVLYTIKMDETRMRPEDVAAMDKLTKAFGETFWENAIFVLTFANKVESPKIHPDDTVATRKYFDNKMDQWKKQVQNALKKVILTQEIADDLVFVPAGYYNRPDLPGRKLWLSQLFDQAGKRMKRHARPAMLKINVDRLKAIQDVNPDDFKQVLHKQPLFTKAVSSLALAANFALAGSYFLGPYGAVGGAVLGAALSWFG